MSLSIHLTDGFDTRVAPLKDFDPLLMLGMTCVFVFYVVQATKSISMSRGRMLSRWLLTTRDPLAVMRTRRKFTEQTWQLVIHVSMTVLEAYILFYEDGSAVDFWGDYSQLWTPHPSYGQTNKASIHALYLLQLSIWLVTCFQHRFVDERRKDYYVMYLHHLVTIALVSMSYVSNYTRIGVITMFLHDASDIPVDLLKLFNYLELEGASGCYLVEMTFVWNLVSWVYFRFYLFFRKVIWYGVGYGSREVITAPHSGCFSHWNEHRGGVFARHARGHPVSWQLGDGSFSLVENIRAIPYDASCLQYYWTNLVLLATLQVCHVLWFTVFVRIIVHKTRAPTNLAARGRR